MAQSDRGRDGCPEVPVSRCCGIRGPLARPRCDGHLSSGLGRSVYHTGARGGGTRPITKRTLAGCLGAGEDPGPRGAKKSLRRKSPATGPGRRTPQCTATSSDPGVRTSGSGPGGTPVAPSQVVRRGANRYPGGFRSSGRSGLPSRPMPSPRGHLPRPTDTPTSCGTGIRRDGHRSGSTVTRTGNHDLDTLGSPGARAPASRSRPSLLAHDPLRGSNAGVVPLSRRSR